MMDSPAADLSPVSLALPVLPEVADLDFLALLGGWDLALPEVLVLDFPPSEHPQM